MDRRTVKIIAHVRKMSADSPRRSVHKGAQVVSPQPIVDRSIIDSVAGIINDIVPQAYTTAPNTDNKESITWARFEYADINDPALYPDYNEGSSTPPLLLVLGYSTGVQVWLIAATGEATEVLSWRQGIVRTLRVLPNPKTDSEHVDPFEPKRPIVAICDSAGPGPQFCNISFISLKTGEQTKNIKFKNPVCDILANRRSIVVTFLEKIAVFDARTFEDVLTVTTCYPSPGPNPNPVALGTRWLAYSEKKLLPARRSSGGCEGEGVQSYTATVLYAAKSLGKGLRGLGETVASSLTGNSVSPIAVNNMGNDTTQPGVVMILDLQAAKEEKDLDDGNIETVIAHFTAHSDAIVAMTFDLTGALLMTADKRGHDFHVFRIQPHPGGPSLAAVHHLYILHRGDTTAKVQDMTFSADTRWAAISTVRGTTHVFPVAPYGGPIGVRTHSTPHVVNRLSRFHRSAGLTDDGTRSHSPVSHTELPLSIYPYSNPRLPPYPHPTILHPLAQIRQPSSLNHANSQSQPRPQQRQRLHSDDSGTLPLKICACFAPPRAWIYAQRDSSSKIAKKAVDSLFIMACHGNMIQYDLEPKPAAGVPKEKVCDDTMIELEVEAKGQWPLLRSPSSVEIVPPLPSSSSLLSVCTVPNNVQPLDTTEDRWLSQVEIVTHAGPHRRLWMGPQFVFKTYNAPSGVAVNLVEAEAVEIGITGGSRPARSNPVNMPHAASRPLVPVVIDGSGSSYEQSPRFMEAYGDPLDNEHVGIGSGENQLREDLAEAMLETSIAPHRAPGRRSVFERVGQPVTKVVNPLGTVITVSADEEDVSSSQEFDSAEENLIGEAPRSVCAEEGPASLGDLEPVASQTLRDLTEICAEMRSASEPAIDSVPDENIREVKERKELCVEVASTTTTTATTSGYSPACASCSIDFEREDAFRDVPSGLSLCAEQGEIPSSPMTQAKESTARSKRIGKCERADTQEKNIAKAKYVLNYDEDSVVLMENRLSCDRGTGQPRTKESQTSSRQRKDTEKATRTTRQPPKELKTRIDKYVVEEQDDSVVIDDPTRPSDTKIDCTSKKHCETSKEEKKCDDRKKDEQQIAKKAPEASKELVETSKSKSKSKTKCNAKDKNACKDSEGCSGTTKSFVELNIPDVTSDTCPPKGHTESKETQPTPSDDLATMDYHLVENNCPAKETVVSDHSDEDIEHIQRSELTRIPEPDSKTSEKSVDQPNYSDSSPVTQRKNSKSTISDDDLEYIHGFELTEMSDNKENLASVSNNVEKFDKDCSESSRRLSKHALSSDDDLEHVQHSDVCVSAVETVPKVEGKDVTVKPQDKPKSKATKRRKDIVVIEDNTTEEAKVTVMVDPSDDWIASSKSSEKNLTEETQVVRVEQASKSKGMKKRKDIVLIKEDVANVKVDLPTYCFVSKKCPEQQQKQNTSEDIQIVDPSTLESTSKQTEVPIDCSNNQDHLKKTSKTKLVETNSLLRWKEVNEEQMCKPKGNKKKKVILRKLDDSRQMVDLLDSSSPTKNRTKSPNSKLPTVSSDLVAERSQGRDIEIIDIDAMPTSKKVVSSMKVMSFHSLEKKPKDSNCDWVGKLVAKRKAAALQEAAKDVTSESEEKETEVVPRPSAMSWSSIVKKNNVSSIEGETTVRKVIPFHSLEEKPKDPNCDWIGKLVAKRKAAELQEAANDVTSINESEMKEVEVVPRSSVMSSSSIVKKNNVSSIESEITLRKESDVLEPLVETEEILDEKQKSRSSSRVSEKLENELIEMIEEKEDRVETSVPFEVQVTEDISDEGRASHEEVSNPPIESTSSKENSLEPDQDDRNHQEKINDPYHEIQPERSSSSDDSNGHPFLKEKNSCLGLLTSFSLTSATKKSNRSKKKKRR